MNALTTSKPVITLLIQRRHLQILAMVCFLLTFTLSLFAEPADLSRVRLASGRAVYVERHPEKDVHVEMEKLLAAWGRWRLADTPQAADVLVRMKLSGSGAWGRGSIEATLVDAKTQAVLWTSQKQTGNRTVFHGYKSPYTRAAEGIVAQMKEASNVWPAQ